MKTNKRLFVKIGVGICAAACLTLGAANLSVFAKADETPLFQIIDGGSVRMEEPYGMRFSADYSKTLFEGETLKDGYEAGVLLVKTAELQGELVIGTENSKNVTAKVWDTQKGGEKHYRLNAVLSNIPEADFATQVTARAYLKSGDEVTYSNSVSRNVAQVASLAMANGYEGEVLENYVDKVGAQITLPTEVAEDKVTMLVGQTITYSVAPEYLTATVSSTVEGVVNVDGTKITAAKAGATDVTIKLGSSEQTIQINVIGGKDGNVSLGANPFVWVMEGQGTQSVAGNVYTTDYNTRNALMFDMDSTGAHVLNGVNNFAIEAEMAAGTAHPSAGGESRGGVIVYAGSRWMVAYYYNAGYANQIYYYDGASGWLLNSAGNAYLIDTISSDVTQKVTIRVEKIADEIRFYANGEFMRSFKEEAWANAQIGLETKYTERTVTVTEYQVIDEFSLGYHFATDKNMSLAYTGSSFAFAPSTGGLWDGALPSFDGGAMYVALLNQTGRNYTFEAKIRLSQAANASGTIGVMGMWVSGSHKSWLEIAEDGTICAWMVDGAYDTTTKSLADFGLTTADEITVKVEKNGTSMKYYVNGQLAFDLTSQYYDYDARFGVFGIAPAADGSNGGQYGAIYRFVSIQHNA